jgi:hypothetical protein
LLDRPRRIVNLFRPPGRRHNIGPRICQSLRDGTADSRRTSDDDRYLAGKIQWSVCHI